MIARTVRARSSALMPVRHETWSTGTVYGVWCGAVLCSTIGPQLEPRGDLGQDRHAELARGRA